MPEGRRHIEHFRAGNIPQTKSFRPDDRVHQQPSANMPTSVPKRWLNHVVQEPQGINKTQRHLLGQPRAVECQSKEMEATSRTSSSNAEESIAQSDRDENDDPTPSESEPHFQPICGTNSRNVARSVSQVSSRSSRSISRVYSLSDGYSHPAVDNDRLQEPEDDEKAEEVSTAPGGEYTVKWDGHDDPDNPRNMKLARKWAAIAVLAIGSVCVTSASSLYTMTYAQLMEEFNCSLIVATLGLSLFILGLGLGPLVLAPLSENIETMLVARFFTGISGSAFLSVAGGTVGDMFARHELGAPMMIYTASPFLGPELGPLLGGFICEFTSWLLRRKAIRLRRETGDERWRAPIERRERSVAQTVLRAVYRPMMLLALEPMCLSLCIFAAILLGIIYLFFGAFQLVFSTLHGFTLSQVGLSFLGLFVGMMIAILSDPLWRRNYTRLARKREMKVGKLGEYEPEWRLPPAIAGAPLVSIGIFIFAWTTYRHVHWIAPIIGTALFGMG
ncbi:MFS multidrug transporter [Histoplasma capsulatum]|uniref:MFS multidrug transporter n=1 Tax=Ajellomyces capsulatus TaxID=5037 RepID=A0A8A1MAB1_AJECA|nr:MFS multidrug transporter [Histoplasma capsulatum]